MNETRLTPDLLPEPTLRRQPWYLAYLTTLRNKGVEYVSSRRIAQDLDVQASQIAKDLSVLDIKGKTRIGYEVNALEARLRDFLGFGHRHNAVMVGVGSLGAALMRDSGLLRYGLKIVGGVDTDPALVGTDIDGVPVWMPEQLPRLVKEHQISIAIIAVPIEAAQSAADSAVEAGIRALWNFTPTRIRVDRGVVF